VAFLVSRSGTAAGFCIHAKHSQHCRFLHSRQAQPTLQVSAFTPSTANTAGFCIHAKHSQHCRFRHSRQAQPTLQVSAFTPSTASTASTARFYSTFEKVDHRFKNKNDNKTCNITNDRRIHVRGEFNAPIVNSVINA